MGKVIFALVMAGSAVFLAVFLSRESAAGRKGIEAFIAQTQKGAPLSGIVAPAEEQNLRQILGSTSQVRVQNFQAQAQTACFWVELTGKGNGVELRIVLHEAEGTYTVARLSAVAECDCPMDASEPCHLMP